MSAEARRTHAARRRELGRLCLLRTLHAAAPHQACCPEEALPADDPARGARAEAAMRDGHAANAAGELSRAADCFAAAFRLRAAPAGGGAAALLSLCNMRRKQGAHEWCAHVLLLLLTSARPLTDRERAGVARLLTAPHVQLPPVWTAVMLSQVAESFVRLPSPDVCRSSCSPATPSHAPSAAWSCCAPATPPTRASASVSPEVLQAADELGVAL